MVDAVGTTTYSYTLGTGGIELVAEDGPWASDTVTVTNRHGLRSGMVVGQPSGSFATTYGWDAARRMTNVIAGGQGFGYTYLGSGGQIARVSLPGGSTITNTFDTAGRQTSTALRTSGGTTLNLHGYIYDTADRRTRISRTNSVSTSWNGYVSFGYDAAGQLVSAQTTNAAGTEVTSERFGYVYDASQNLRWRTNNTTVTGFTNNTLNQLASLNSTTRTHDRRGNLISSVQPAETLLYTWDDENQLVSVLLDPPSSPAFQPWRIDFIYDGLRRLRRMVQYTWNGSAWTSQGEVRYLYDGMLIVQERSSANTPQVHYSRGLDLSGTIHGAGGIGGLLMRSHGYSAGNWSSHNAYHSDANGNVTALVNSSGVLQASYKYNPYGGLISSSGTLASANRMRFSSKPAIFSSSGAWGFYYYGYRFYDPVNQRWLNRDPLGEAGGRNLYGFVGNDAANLFDPLGLLIHWHHLLPKAVFTPETLQALGLGGLDIHAAEWGWELDSVPHQKVHKAGWNREWNDWVNHMKETGKPVTKELLRCKTDSMINRFGLRNHGKPAAKPWKGRAQYMRELAEKLRKNPKAIAGLAAIAGFVVSTSTANANAMELQEQVVEWQVAANAGDAYGTQHRAPIIAELMSDLSGNGLVSSALALHLFDPPTSRNCVEK
jgi:RHS repeat-associated protein